MIQKKYLISLCVTSLFLGAYAYKPSSSHDQAVSYDYFLNVSDDEQGPAQPQKNDVADLDQLGTEPVSVANESFIRALQQEMGLDAIKLTIRKMNDEAIALVGRENAFVVGGHDYLFVSEEWFNELSAAEKRFLIGHELAHLLNDHSHKKQTADVALSLLVDFVIGQIGNNQTPGTWQHKGIAYAQKIGFGIIKLLLLAKLSRNCEEDADQTSVAKLQSAAGGVALFERMGTSSSTEQVSFIVKFIRRILGCFASHPGHAERIAYLRQHMQNTQ